MNKVFKVPVIESEKGWGQKIDDYMVCLTKEKAESFIIDFNAKNDKLVVPDWYMRAENEIQDHTITDSQLEFIKTAVGEYAWLSFLKHK